MMLGWKQNGGWKRKAIGVVMVVLTASLLVGVMAAQRDYDRKNEKAHHYPTRQLNVQFIRSNAIEVAIAANGQFTIGIPNGPILLYGHPNPWSSATTIRVDGVDYWNYDGAKLAPIIDGPRNENDLSNLTIWDINGIKVTQRLAIVKGISGQFDTVRIEYTLENATQTVHTVGVRLMLDTMLGNNDGAPFRVPGIGAVLSEREWLAGNIPAFWEAFDNLDAPSVKSRGTLLGGEATLPDRLVAANWRHINDTPWDFTPDPNIAFADDDSAIGIYWNPTQLLPRQKRTLVTYYGLSAIAGAGGNLVIGLSTTVLDIKSASPFDLVTYVSANRWQDNVRISITLPEGLELASGESTQTISTINAGEIHTITWQLRATGDMENTRVPISFSAISQSGDRADLTIDVYIGRIYTVRADGYVFANSPNSFGYPVNNSFINYWYPSWEIFREVFGPENTEVEGVPRPDALRYWLRIRRPWGGSCDGMSVTSRLFDIGYLDPITYGATKVHDLPVPGRPEAPLTRLIERYQLYQFGRQVHAEFTLAPNNAKGVLQRVREALSSGEGVIIWIRGPYQGRPVGHSVVPWRLEVDKNQPNKWRIYVYDPNDPYPPAQKHISEQRYIEIIDEGEKGTWSFQIFSSNPNIIWNQSNGEIRCLRLRAYMENPTPPWWSDPQFGGDWFVVITSAEDNIKIINTEGQSAQLTGSNFISDIPGAVHIPIVAVPADPNQFVPSTVERFFLPPSTYTITLSGQSKQNKNMTKDIAVFGQGRTIAVTTDAASTVQVDGANGSVTATADLGTGSVNINLIQERSNNDIRSAEITAFVTQGGRCTVQHDSTGVTISVQDKSAAFNIQLSHMGVTNGTGAVQQVVVNPNEVVRVRFQDPNNPETSPVLVERDRNQDGSYEETLQTGTDTVIANFPSGVHFISLPIVPRNLTWTFLLSNNATVNIAAWDSKQSRYEIVSIPSEEPLSGNLQATSGKGFWVKLPNVMSVTIKGTNPQRLGINAIRLVTGWNSIGTLGDYKVIWSLSNIKVRRGNEERTLAQAQQAGWIEDYVWGWEQDANNPNTGRYVLVYDTSIIPGVKGQLEPWKGYWVYAHTDCELILPPPSQSKGRGTRGEGRVAKGNGWSMRLQASVNGSVGEAVLGIANGTRGLAVGLPPEPPTGNNGVQVILLKNNTPLAVDVRSDGARRQEWEVLVRFGTRDGGRGTSERKEVVLTFDGIGYAPKDVSAWLVDTVTGKRVYLRTQPSYRFAPEVGETERRFKVIVESGNERPLRIVGLKATPMRGEGLVITFALTKPAQVRGEVMTLTGRKIAVMDEGSTRMAGTHRMIWRGVGSEGVKVPVGAYLVRLVATDEDGRQVQAVTVVRGR
jgi:hypothetical protein